MSSGIKILETIQCGVEVTKGTLVAATRRIIGDGRYRRIQNVQEFLDQNSGVFARVPRAGVVTRHASQIEVRMPLDFTQVLLPLRSGMKGGVTGVGAGADKLHTFDPSTATPPALDAFTMEYTERSPDDNAEMEFGYGITEEIEISGNTDNLAELRFRMFGRATADSTMTAALTVPTLPYAAPAKWGIFDDSSFAGIGVTQVLAQVYGFRWTYKSAVHPGFYLDNRATLDFSTEEYGRPDCELELDVVHDPDSVSFIQAHEAFKTAQTLRFFEVRLTGATLGTTNYLVKLQGAFYHMDDSMEERGNDRDGNLTVRMHLGSAFDPTSAAHVKALVTTDVATFP